MQSDSANTTSLILIIEDDKSLSNMYSTKFNSSGYQTIVANDGEAGLTAAKAQRPSLILLDMMLPDIKGEEIAKSISQDDELKNIPIVILSNLADTKQLEDAKRNGVREYLLKAMYSPDQILQIVQKYL